MKALSSGFSAAVACKVVGISYRQLDYWDKTGLLRPSVQAAAGKGSRRVYSFEDLVELRVVARLVSVGVTLSSVRKTARYLRQNFADVIRPLARLALVVDGKRVLVRTTDKRHLLDASGDGQFVICFAVAPIAKDLRAKVTELGAPRTISVRVAGSAYEVRLTPDLEVGGYTVEVPSLPGVVTEANTVGEARRHAADAIRAWTEVARGSRKTTRSAAR